MKEKRTERERKRERAARQSEMATRSHRINGGVIIACEVPAHQHPCRPEGDHFTSIVHHFDNGVSFPRRADVRYLGRSVAGPPPAPPVSLSLYSP